VLEKPARTTLLASDDPARVLATIVDLFAPERRLVA
jgi:hypothetical protein